MKWSDWDVREVPIASFQDLALRSVHVSVPLWTSYDPAHAWKTAEAALDADRAPNRKKACVKESRSTFSSI